MREISYRAKRKDNGEWVEGYLFDDGMVDSKRMFIGSLVITEHKGLGEDVWDIGHDFYEVLPETVGQYTGLLDKDGKKVFEGDIVKNKYRRGQYQYFKIVYDTRVYCWQVENKYGMLGFLYNVIGDLEVIGNIYDDPKLLEVK